jgi:hypothetical protein
MKRLSKCQERKKNERISFVLERNGEKGVVRGRGRRVKV